MQAFTAHDVRRILEEHFSSHIREVVHIEGFQRAAVLVPLTNEGAECVLLFTRRTETVETHKGQISFPGGVVDGADRDVVETALRETHEEVGILPDSVQTLGLLDDILTPAGFVITPVVGFLADPPNLNPSEHEVAEAFTVPLSFFANPANGRTEYREFRGKRNEVWFYDTGKHMIWGATARIVRLLMERLGMG